VGLIIRKAKHNGQVGRTDILANFKLPNVPLASRNVLLG
jgi:hypothetical protein